MPAYNESVHIRAVLSSFIGLSIGAPWELIVVDDGSSDDTAAKVTQFASEHPELPLRLIRHRYNRGKGAAVRSLIAKAGGTHLLTFDADSEYDTDDIVNLVSPIRRGRAEVVYGVRVRGHTVMLPSLLHGVGNIVMTMTANLIYGAWISDLHTCLKLLPLPLLRAMRLTESGFGLDTEITAEMLRRGFRPYEVSVSYVGRSKGEGKKINFSDALRCFVVLGKVRLRGVISRDQRNRALSPAVRFDAD